ncbi:MAG: hypothetical protein WCH11_06375, partial [Bdellovibrio sp.]
LAAEMVPHLQAGPFCVGRSALIQDLNSALHMEVAQPQARLYFLKIGHSLSSKAVGGGFLKPSGAQSPAASLLFGGPFMVVVGFVGSGNPLLLALLHHHDLAAQKFHQLLLVDENGPTNLSRKTDRNECPCRLGSGYQCRTTQTGQTTALMNRGQPNELALIKRCRFKPLFKPLGNIPCDGWTACDNPRRSARGLRSWMILMLPMITHVGRRYYSEFFFC